MNTDNTKLSAIDKRYPSYFAEKDGLLETLYGTMLGRMLLQPMCTRGFSAAVGKIMDSSVSRPLINTFIQKFVIPMDDYEDVEYHSFNEFFTRNIKAGARPIDQNADHLISPCDSKVTAFKITEDSLFKIKGVPYSIASLLRSEKLAERYQNGYIYIFRLSVDDYHRYCYPDNGRRTRYVRIPGVYHTVNPMVLDHVNIYRENTREYAVLRTEHFGDLLMMQVGAMLVGRICNNQAKTAFKRGEEAGMFEYGGSTVVLLTEDQRVIPNRIILERSLEGIETVVRMGECVGVSPAFFEQN
ncbi:MAG: phosphatidylserine decarboxylase [Clostridia bacterium]|nr:phosphatidylserine decarboxylase [Clostridia bacterium]